MVECNTRGFDVPINISILKFSFPLLNWETFNDVDPSLNGRNKFLARLTNVDGITFETTFQNSNPSTWIQTLDIFKFDGFVPINESS